MSDEDWWSRWSSRKQRWPFFRGWFSEDINEFFKEMEELMEREFKELSKQAPSGLVRERTMPDGRKVKQWGPFVYGYSVTIGPDGKPEIKEFGNVKPETRRGRPRIRIAEEREPLVDILESDGDVRVIAELPGVEKGEIKLHGTERSLTILVDTPKRKYHKVVKLPSKVDPKRSKSSYKNGVLQVVMPREVEGKPKGEPISVD